MAILSVAVEAMMLLQTEMQLHACDALQLNWKQEDGRHVTIVVANQCNDQGEAKYLPPKKD